MNEIIDEDYIVDLLLERGIRIYKEEITYIDEEIFEGEIEIGFDGAIFIRKDEKGDPTIKDLLIDGLSTDGAHHKQWYLEQLVKKLGFDLDKIRKSFDLDEGIAP